VTEISVVVLTPHRKCPDISSMTPTLLLSKPFANPLIISRYILYDTDNVMKQTTEELAAF
jgi:hypothetical protein